MLDFHVVACPSIPWLSKHNAVLQERVATVCMELIDLVENTGKY